MRYQHIVFDVDGTLIDTGYAGLRSLQDTLIELTGSSPSLQELEFSLGIPSHDALERLGVADVPAAAALWSRKLLSYRDTVRVYEGIPTLLEELERRGYLLGLVTSRSRRELEQDFSPFPISNYFRINVCSDDTLSHKPEPDPLFQYMFLTGAAQGELLYVGDRETDLQCAQGAWVDFALAGWGNPDPDGAIAAKYRLGRPGELLDVIG